MNKTVKKEINKIRKEAKGAVEDNRKTMFYRPILIILLLISLIIAIVTFAQNIDNAISTPLCIAMLIANVVLLIFAAEIRKIITLIIVSALTVFYVISALAISFYSAPCDPSNPNCMQVVCVKAPCPGAFAQDR